MRLEFATRLEAGEKAVSIHNRLIAADPDYALAVQRGEITAWARPYQDTDRNGVPIPGSTWYVNTKERIRTVLTPEEQAVLRPDRGAL